MQLVELVKPFEYLSCPWRYGGFQTAVHTVHPEGHPHIPWGAAEWLWFAARETTGDAGKFVLGDRVDLTAIARRDGAGRGDGYGRQDSENGDLHGSGW